MVPTVLCAAVLLLYAPYLTTGVRAGNDARDMYAYYVVVADAVAQCRSGVFPVYVGQSALRYNGGMYPQAQAPLLTTAACAVDAFTLRRLRAASVLNAVLVLAALAAAGGMYRALLEVGRGHAVAAGLLALAFVACPGVAGLLFRLDMVMSLLAVAFIPWVWLALWRIWGGGGWRAGLWLGSSFALVLMAHPPIALWTGLAAAVAAAVGLIAMRRGARALTVAVAFTCLAASWPLAVFRMLGAGTGLASPDRLGRGIEPGLADIITDNARAELPGSLLPVGWVPTHRPNDMPAHGPGGLDDWGRGAWTPYLQLGYALWTTLIAAAWWAWRSGDARLVSLAAGGATLCLFQFPVVPVTDRLWRVLPSFFDMTRWWAAQRIYPVLASLAAVAGAAAWTAWRDGAPGPSRRVSAAVAALMTVWLASEAAKFTAFGFRRPVDRAVERVENIALRTNELQMAARRKLPPFSDPVLHQHVRGEGRLPDLDNEAALSRRCLEAERLAALGSEPVSLVLRPGSKVVVCLAPDSTATLTAAGPGFFRDYRVAAHGLVLLPLWTSGPTRQQVELTLSSPTGAPLPWPRDGLRSAEYTPHELPVRVRSVFPYRVTVRVEEPGLQLETSRQCAPGYTARVNGAAARVGCSSDGYVTVALQQGKNAVELRYDPPPSIRLASWASLVTLSAAMVTALSERHGQAVRG